MPTKLHAAANSAEREIYGFHCPGCKCAHMIPIREQRGPVWGWNGSLDRPSFSPSIFYTDPGHRCHSFVTDGRIQYLGDSDHALAGSTVELPDWNEPETLMPEDILSPAPAPENAETLADVLAEGAPVEPDPSAPEVAPEAAPSEPPVEPAPAKRARKADPEPAAPEGSAIADSEPRYEVRCSALGSYLRGEIIPASVVPDADYRARLVAEGHLAPAEG